MATEKDFTYSVGVVAPTAWPSDRRPEVSRGKSAELRGEEILIPKLPLASVPELRTALGTENFCFFGVQHPFAYRIKDIVARWHVPNAKISNAIKACLLPEPVKLFGPGKQIITAAMLDYLFSARSGIHGLPILCARRDLVSSEAGLKLPLSGSGSSPDDPVTLIMDPSSGRLLADQDFIFLNEKIWFKLTVWVDEVRDIIPNHPTIPADPIDALKVLIVNAGHQEKESTDETLSLVTESFRSEEHQGALSKIEILAAKICGSEAPYVRKCLWIALLAATIPWTRGSMLAYVNRLIESEGGKKISMENLADRLYLAKHFLLLREKQLEYDYKILPTDLKTGKFLQKFGDNEIPEIWERICFKLLETGRPQPKLQDLVAGYDDYVAQRTLKDDIENPLELTAEKREIVEAAINARFADVASKIRTTLRQTGIHDPQEALVYRLESNNIDSRTIETVWMALTSTDM